VFIPSFVLAQLSAPTPDNFGEFVQAVLGAATSGQWALVAAFVLVAVVWGLRKLPWPPLKTPEGGAVLNILTGFAGAFLSALVGGAAFSWALVLTSLQVSVLAAGGWSLLKSLVFPLLLRVPAFAKLFSRGSAAEAVTAAEKQGLAAAVVAKAPTSDEIANGR
jgi:hypothetical protein